jgi:hypothetical protein
VRPGFNPGDRPIFPSIGGSKPGLRMVGGRGGLHCIEDLALPLKTNYPTAIKTLVGSILLKEGWEALSDAQVLCRGGLGSASHRSVMG